jgi:hypothetical protein
VGATDTCTVKTWATNPDSTSVYVVFATPPASDTSLPSVNTTQFGGTNITSAAGIPEVKVASIAANAITAASIAADAITAAKVADGAIDAATFAAGAINAAAIAADAITAAKIADGAIDAATFAAGAINAAAIAADAITAAKVAADVTTEIQSGLATAANLATVAGYLDTEIAAIKAKTDSLAFTVAGKVDANIHYVNGVAVTGTGASGDEWGP